LHHPRRVQPLLVSLVLVLGLVLTACQNGAGGRAPEDLDGEPTTAVAVVVGTALGGTLECADETGPDCRDWYRFQPRQPGMLRVVAKSIAPRTEGEEGGAAVEAAGPSRPLQLQLTDGNGTMLAEGEGEEATVHWRIREPGALLALVTVSPGEGPIRYELTTKIEDAPRTRSIRQTVLEVEAPRDGGAAHVLIDGGLDQSISVGLRGKLLQDGRSIGRIRIVEVFPQGSRATVEGELASPVTPETVAEIELPLR
jgi:hypothetical protein